MEVQPERKKQILELISSEHILTLDSISGVDSIWRATDLFEGIDKGFSRFQHSLGEPTKEIEVKIFSLKGSATYLEMFRSINKKPDQLCLTQHQIICFVRKYRWWIEKDRYDENLFLFKGIANDLHIAFIAVNARGTLSINQCLLYPESSSVWTAQHKLVVPVI